MGVVVLVGLQVVLAGRVGVSVSQVRNGVTGGRKVRRFEGRRKVCLRGRRKALKRRRPFFRRRKVSIRTRKVGVVIVVGLAMVAGQVRKVRRGRGRGRTERTKTNRQTRRKVCLGRRKALERR